MMSLTFGLFTQVSGSGPLGPLVFFDMNPIALREAKIVHNFGLSECNRVKRQTVVLSKDIKIFCNIIIYFTVKSR